MTLVKAEIQNTDTSDKVTVLFNPKEYTFEKAVPWKEHNIQGLDTPSYEWTSGAPMQLHVELFFDVYEETGAKRDVRQLTDKIEDMAYVNPDKHRPPILLFCWGKKLQFKCLLKSLTQRFTLFLDDGTPVRAVLNCVFTEYCPPSDQLQGKPRHSPDHTKRRVVKQGDTLSWIAGKEYGNPAEWRIIADANRIDDPMNLTAGQELLIPPLY
jgi:nucleoid-associated protein YgaU